MPRNVEIKARVDDIAALREAACKLSDTDAVLKQCDTFFNSANGRLKLREIKNQPGQNQLIYYDRSDVSGPKLSNYLLYPTDNPAALKDILTLTNGIKGEVRKTRHLYMVGQTRVHVDQVDGLGDFMELEVVLRDEQMTQDGEAIAKDLMHKLGVGDDQLMTGAYMDMLAAKGDH